MSDLYNFTPDMSAPVATSPDLSRQVATDDEYISIKEALDIFISHGRAVTERTLQRYCVNQQLDGQKRLTAEGEKWFVRRSSVSRLIEELEKFDALRASRHVATGPDVSAPVTEVNQHHVEHDKPRQVATENVSSLAVTQDISHTTSPDMPRQDATGRDMSVHGETPQPQNASSLHEKERELYERMMVLLKEQRADLIRDKVMLQEDKAALLRQLDAKDKQIERFFASERDTKTLFGRFQGMFSGLLPKKAGEGGERYVPEHEAIDSGLPEQRDER